MQDGRWSEGEMVGSQWGTFHNQEPAFDLCVHVCVDAMDVSAVRNLVLCSAFASSSPLYSLTPGGMFLLHPTRGIRGGAAGADGTTRSFL